MGSGGPVTNSPAPGSRSLPCRGVAAGDGFLSRGLSSLRIRGSRFRREHFLRPLTFPGPLPQVYAHGPQPWVYTRETPFP